MNQNAERIEANLGSVEKAWKSVTAAAKDAWDGMLGVGRAQTTGGKLAALEAELRQRQTTGSASGLSGPGIDQANAKRVAQLQVEIGLLQDIAKEEQKSASRDAERAQSLRAEVAWSKEIAGLGKTKQDLANGELELRNKGAAAGKSQVEIEKAIGQYRKANAGMYNEGAEARQHAAQQKTLVQLERLKVLQAQATADRVKGYLSEYEGLEELNELELRGIDIKITGLQLEREAVKGKVNGREEVKKLDAQIEALRLQQQAKQIEGERKIEEVTEKRRKALKEAVNDYAKEVEESLAKMAEAEENG